MHIDFKPIQLWRCLASCFAQICQVVNASLRAKNRSSAAENKSRHRHCTQPSNWTIRSGGDDQSVSQSIDFKCFILYNKIFHIPPCDNCTNGICQFLHVQFEVDCSSRILALPQTEAYTFCGVVSIAPNNQRQSVQTFRNKQVLC